MQHGYSFQSLNPENGEEARLSDDRLFGQLRTVRFPFDRKPSNIRDDKLWQDFGNEIDELLPLLNKDLGLLLFVTPLLVFIAWLPTMEVLGASSIGEVGLVGFMYLFFTLSVAILFTFDTQPRIVNRNRQVDEQIHQTCANYTPPFQEHGIVPQYRTKWTEMCNLKGARPLRMIVFVPAGTVYAQPKYTVCQNLPGNDKV